MPCLVPFLSFSNDNKSIYIGELAAELLFDSEENELYRAGHGRNIFLKNSVKKDDILNFLSYIVFF
jgi:hypothetical protein